MLVAGQVTLAGIDDTFAAVLDPDERWNGWYCPLLPREQVERVMAHDDRLRWDGDTVVELLDEVTGEEQRYVRHTFVSAGCSVGPVWSLGAYGWTWYVVWD